MSKKRRLGTGKKRHKMKRYANRNRHHLQAKSLGGKNTPQNLLLIKIERHRAWHDLFGLLNLEEVIQLLQRLQRCKAKQKN